MAIGDFSNSEVDDGLGTTSTTSSSFTDTLYDSTKGILNQFGIGDLADMPPDYQLGQSKYDFTSRVFPTNLNELGHYMVININVPNRSTYSSINGRRLYTRLPNEVSKTDALRYNIDQGFVDDNGRQLNQGQVLRPRFTRRIAESIALWTPQTMQYVQQNEYADISLTNMAGRVAQFTMNTGLGFLGGLIGSVNTSLGNAVIGVGDVISEGMQLAAQGMALAGTPINPKIEYMFRTTKQRHFLFDFLFAPETREDTMAMDQIIRTLRFHGSPEIDTGTYGFTYTPPSEFDITFYHKGQENLSIPRINTLILDQIDLDYAPGGVWATFSNGYPVSCRMQLRFTETEVVSKLRVAQGF